MRGADFVQVARSLAETRQEAPARLRTAVSRAYYGAYLEVREAMRPFRGKVTIDEYSSHANVRLLLRNCGVDGCVSIAKHLGELHARRQEADYELTPWITPENVCLCIKQAEIVIAFVGPLSTGAGRRSLCEGLRGYLQRTNQLGANFPAA